MRPEQRRWPRGRIVLFIAITLFVVADIASVVANTPGGGAETGEYSDGTLPISELRVTMTPALANFYEQKLEWHGCHKRYTCTRVSVPTDWGHPAAGSVFVALIKHAATGVSRGALVVDPGGPGASGVELVQYGVTEAVDAKVASDYDVVGLDPRGVGSSTPVTCLDDAAQDDYLYRPLPGKVGSAEWIAGQKENANNLAAACRRNTGALLNHLDTVSAAHDLDVVRAALGEKKLNYLGYSWGSYLGTVYAGLYPQNVGRFVFDGIDDPWSASDDTDSSANSTEDEYDFSSDGAVAQARSFESSLESYLAECVKESTSAVGNSACPFPGDLTSAKRQVAKLFAAAQAAPLRNTDGRELGAATLATATIEPLYSGRDWPRLTTMFRQLLAANSSQAFTLADEYNERSESGQYYDNSSTASLAIECLEGGSAVDLDYDRAQLRKLREVAPILGSSFAFGDLVCSGWRSGDVAYPQAITADGAGPILLVGTTNDPATPYQDAKNLTRQLKSAYLVTYNGEGHTAYNLGNACVDLAVDSYLVDGLVPKSDPECR